MADTGPRGPQGPAGTSIDLPVAIANGGTGATTAKGAAEALQVETLGARTLIGEGVDLDSFMDVGCYGCTSNAIAQSLTNCPSEFAFVLSVGLATGNTSYHTFQMLREYSRGVLYYRLYDEYIAAWGAWYCIANPDWETRIAALEATIAAL